MRTLPKFFCLIVAGMCAFAVCCSRAANVEVDWSFDTEFSPDSVTINVGDEVDFFNYDETYDLQLTGNPPESFYADIPPAGSYVYYVPVVYSSLGTYTASDEFYDLVFITVNPVAPLSVSITAPTNTMFTAPATFTVTAAPAGGFGSYNVQFFVGANGAGDITSSPFSTTVNNLPVGNYVISAVVTDSAFNTASNSIVVNVGPPLATNYIAPVACANLYSNGTVGLGGYLEVDPDPHGGLEFAAFNASGYTSILLELFPYGLPLLGPTVSVYGFDGADGTLVASNYNSGTLIATATFPSEYSQFDFLDVTAFVKSVKGPYFGFILVSDSFDLFSSTSKNYGTPPELFAIYPVLPQLTAARAGNQMIISWPTNNSAGYSLQWATNLQSGGTWNTVLQTPALAGTNWVMTNSVSRTNTYFRLISQ